jgi:hypothetical protein
MFMAWLPAYLLTRPHGVQKPARKLWQYWYFELSHLQSWKFHDTDVTITVFRMWRRVVWYIFSNFQRQQRGTKTVQCTVHRAQSGTHGHICWTACYFETSVPTYSAARRHIADHINSKAHPYTELQGDQKVSVHLMITIQKVTSNVQSVPRQSQTFIDTPNCALEDRVQYVRSTFRIYSVMAIFISSIVWGLFEYTEFFVM